jgi:hypothetical protein
MAVRFCLAAPVKQVFLMQKVLIDASSAILLIKADLIDSLLMVYEVMMADTVYREVNRPGYFGAARFAELAADLRLTIRKTPIQSRSR